LNNVRVESLLRRGKIIQRLLHRFRAGDNCRNLWLCQDELQGGMRHGRAFGNEFGKLLDQLTSTRNHLRGPAFSNVIKTMAFAITTGKPARIQRHLNNDSYPILIGVLECRKRFLIEGVEKYFQRFTLRGIHDHIHLFAPIQRNAIFTDLALGFEFFKFLILGRNPAVHHFARWVMHQDNIQIISLQCPQTCLDRGANGMRAEIRDALCGVTKLGAEDDIFPHGFQPFAEQFFAPAPAVAGRGVEEVTARLQRFLNNAQGFISIVDAPIRVC